MLGVGAFVAFIAGKILGPSFKLPFGEGPADFGNLKNFRFVENDKELKLYDKSGDEIFVLEKE